MAYTKDFFGLQLEFARRISDVTHRPLEDALLEYTNFYRAFKTDWLFDAENPIWREFLEKFKASKDPLQTIFDFYNIRKSHEYPKKLFGCFWYDFEPHENYIQIHFSSHGNPHTLSTTTIEQRMSELKEMFTEIKQKYPDVKTVAGFSWLYNIEPYRRLFPPEYTSNPTIVTSWYKTLAVWGQFIDCQGKLRSEPVAKFRKCVATKNTLEEILECFPLKVLQPETDIEYFYEFYGIE